MEPGTLLEWTLSCLLWLHHLWVHGGYNGPDIAQWVRGLRPKLAVQVVNVATRLGASRFFPGAERLGFPSYRLSADETLAENGIL